jgi:methionine sulfoxide reductase catalytic subunit
MKNKPNPIPSSEITPEQVYLNRRRFIQLAGLGGAAALLAACAPASAPQPQTSGSPSDATAMPAATNTSSPGLKDELGDPANTFDEITHYNNYYEFSTDKEPVADMAVRFKTSPWSVEVGGMVQKPTTYAIEDLLKKFPAEERIYRHRCVEGWSMVIPWNGFPLSKLLKEVQPTGDAKYVAFQTLYDTAQYPGQMDPMYPWPYTEGLRLDEAMNDLALMVTGMYGKTLPNQDGAPLRLAVPWKYGFKSIKAIIKIDLVSEMPKTLWSEIAPNEYGFYANVNPDVPHPRWSQSSERRIGEMSRRKTLLFNGYTEQVSSLYSGMDLRANY